MENEKNNRVVDTAGNLSMFLTFFTLSWIVYLFPEVINNFFSLTIAKWLLVASAFSISLFENNRDGSKKLGFADFGIGLGMVIIFIGFVNSFEFIIYKILMLIIFAFFGLFGMYRGICIPIAEALFYNKNQLSIKNNTVPSLSVKTLNIILNIIELIAAVVTILTFAGISF